MVDPVLAVSADPYDAVQDTRSDRSEWNEGDTQDDAAEAFRWGFTPDGREPEDSGREQ
jgi:hypothetical protein